MKKISATFCISVMLGLACHADGEDPPSNLIEHAKWARDTKDLAVRIKRLEEFLRGYIPIGSEAVVLTEYEDGASSLAVTGSAWTLARAYVEAGQKDMALRVINWLQENDSKSDLSPKNPESEQDVPAKSDRSGG